MATPAPAPVQFRAAVPRTSLAHFIEVDDWAVEEPESNLKRMARKVNDLLRGTKREALAKVRQPSRGYLKSTTRTYQEGTMVIDGCRPTPNVASTSSMLTIDLIKSLSRDELTKAIQALRKMDEFVHDKAAQTFIEFMEEELSARTV